MDDLDMCTINSVVQDAQTMERQVKTIPFSHKILFVLFSSSSVHDLA